MESGLKRQSSREWVEDQIQKWLELFANHTTTDPMGDFFHFREGARNLLGYIEDFKSVDEEEG